MISKSKISYIRSLHDKACRYEEWIFLVEGKKSIVEFIASDFEIIEGYLTETFLTGKTFDFPVSTVNENELSRITTLSSNDSWVILVKMKTHILPNEIKDNELVLVLDSINDPGNLGTIIRIADWYGVARIIASSDTVDCYNPKVIMATMGSFSRIPIIYTNIVQYLSKFNKNIYWAYLDGENIHTASFPKDGIHVVIGNEAHGISNLVSPLITSKITIPRFGKAESLNAWVATAIIIDRIVGSVN
jgi:TrmH family RNA methyltransferase